MARKHFGIAAELHEVGFSTRAINALVYGFGLERLHQLRTAPWGSVEARKGLSWDLLRVPNLGPRGLAQVQSFREHGSASLASELSSTIVSVRLSPAECARLQAWAEERGVSRPEAARLIVLRGLEAS
jgi:hypothetical protein